MTKSTTRLFRTLSPLALRPRGLHHQIVQELGQRILRGDTRPGDVLPGEIELSAEFGVSRTVLREASRILAEKGLVESRPRIGTRVCPRHEWNLLDADVLAWSYLAGPDLQFLHDLSDVRTIIEPAAAQRAAQRGSDAELTQLGRLIEQMDAVTADPDAYIDIDLQFHGLILSASHNELLAQMTRTISVALEISRQITVRLDGGAAAFMPQHRAVCTAIQKREGTAAFAAMERLISDTASGMQEVLAQQEPPLDRSAPA